MAKKIDKRIGLWIGMALLALLVGIGAMASATFAATPSGAPVVGGPAATGGKAVSSGGVNNPLDTPTPTPTCGVVQNYNITQSTGTIIPGTTDIGNHIDDGTTTIALPFPVSFYGTSFSSAIVGSNGTIGFTANANTFTNTCLPYTSGNNFIAP